MESSNHLRALAHPVRLRILSLLTGAELTAAEVARELGITHANASYHLRFLLDAGEIVVSGEEKIRGGVARRYRHHWRRRTARGPSRRGRPRGGHDGRARGSSRSSAAGTAPAAADRRAGHRCRALGRVAPRTAPARSCAGHAASCTTARRPAHRRHRAGEPPAVAFVMRADS